MKFCQLLCLFLVVCSVSSFRKQGVAVRGRLLCGQDPLKNTHVKIYDLDRNPGDSDDMLDDGYTDSKGYFELDGTTRELTSIEPQLRIYHDCNDGIRPCQKAVLFDLPKKYIHSGTAEKWLDIGEINMEMTFRGEDRECNH